MAYGFNDDKTKYDLMDMAEYYALPFTHNDTDITITGLATGGTNLIINPQQKMMYLTIEISNNTDSEISATNRISNNNPILCDLPLLIGVNKQYHYMLNCIMWVSGNGKQLTHLVLTNSNDAHGSSVTSDPVNQSVLYLFDSLPSQASIHGYFAIPYYDLSALHPMSEATLLGDPNA